MVFWFVGFCHFSLNEKPAKISSMATSRKILTSRGTQALHTDLSVCKLPNPMNLATPISYIVNFPAN